jgi:hypothetical protein
VIHLASDESGNFHHLAGQGFDSSGPSLWATVLCPESTRDSVETLVRELCARWDIDELHAKTLPWPYRLEACAALAATDIRWVATVTDASLFSAEELVRWRVEQAAKFERSWQASQARGTTHPEYEGRDAEIRDLLSNARRVRPAHYLQHAVVAPGHIHACLSAAVRAFRAPRYDADWNGIRLVFDSKQGGGQALLREALRPILAATDMTLDMPLDYLREGHPLYANHRLPSGGLDLRSLFGTSPEFVESSSEPLVQVADVVAWVLRRRLSRPDDADAGTAMRLLQLRQWRPNPLGLRFLTRKDYALEDVRQYAHVLPH